MTTPKQKTSMARVTKLRDGNSTEENVTSIAGQHVGDILRQARESRGMTLDMVADELMIRRFYLEALEAGSFRDLPERVYATGFVRSYATYIGLDPVQTMEQFRRDAYGARNGNYQVELVMPEPVIHSVMPGRTAIIAAFCILAVIGGGVMVVMRDKARAVNTIPTPPETAAVAATEEVSTPVEQSYTPPAADATTSATVTETAPETNTATATPSTGFDAPETPNVSAPATAAENNTTTPAPTEVGASLPSPTAAASLPADNAAATATEDAATAKNETPAPAVSTKGVSIEALESSWVEVKDAGGKVLFTNILKKGQLLPIPDQKGITLTTGNAGGLRVMLDGKVLGPLGQTNEVKRNVSLDVDKLSKL